MHLFVNDFQRKHGDQKRKTIIKNAEREYRQMMADDPIKDKYEVLAEQVRKQGIDPEYENFKPNKSARAKIEAIKIKLGFAEADIDQELLIQFPQVTEEPEKKRKKRSPKKKLTKEDLDEKQF